MTEKPCIITGPDPDIELKHCRRCGLEWHKSERKPNCPFIETSAQKIERLEDENVRMKTALGNIKSLARSRLRQNGPDGNFEAIEGFARIGLGDQ